MRANPVHVRGQTAVAQPLYVHFFLCFEIQFFFFVNIFMSASVETGNRDWRTGRDAWSRLVSIIVRAKYLLLLTRALDYGGEKGAVWWRNALQVVPTSRGCIYF